MEMARDIQDKTAVVKGVPVVEPSNKYFWFNRPDIILFLIHFTLFQVIFTLNNLSRLDLDMAKIKKFTRISVDDCDFLKKKKPEGAN
jgi:hypothetical protein